MVSPVINQNLAPINSPTLTDVLNQWKKDVMINLNCHHVGIVQSFDPAEQTATVTIAYTKTIFEANASGLYSPKYINYPILIECPVIFLGGADAALSFPVAQGDECLVVINDRDIDNWFQTGQVGPVATPRTHSFADAFALVGIRSKGNAIDDFDPARAVLFNGLTGVGVSTTKVKIYNASTTLNTLLQQILTQLETLANTVSVPASPLNPAVAMALAALATQLGGLLE